MDSNKQRTCLKNNSSGASLLAVALVFCASPSVLFVVRRAKLTANTHSSICGLNFQTRTDSLSDGHEVGPKVLVQHSHANKHWRGWACMVIFHTATPSTLFQWTGVCEKRFPTAPDANGLYPPSPPPSMLVVRRCECSAACEKRFPFCAGATAPPSPQH